MKSKKWPLAHVWSHIITLKHPKLTPFVSARRYDPEEVLEHMFGASNSHKKKFSRPTSPKVVITQTQFLSSQQAKYLKMALET